MREGRSDCSMVSLKLMTVLHVMWICPNIIRLPTNPINCRIQRLDELGQAWDVNVPGTGKRSRLALWRYRTFLRVFRSADFMIPCCIISPQDRIAVRQPGNW